MFYIRGALISLILYLTMLASNFSPIYFELNTILFYSALFVALQFLPETGIVGQYQMVEKRIFYSLIIALLVLIALMYVTDMEKNKYFYMSMTLLWLFGINLHLYFISKKHVINRYILLIPDFFEITSISIYNKYKYTGVMNSINTLELLAWPYSGVQFYLKKQDGDLWELIAPKIVAESFIKDLEKYSGERIEVKEKREL